VRPRAVPRPPAPRPDRAPSPRAPTAPPTVPPRPPHAGPGKLHNNDIRYKHFLDGDGCMIRFAFDGEGRAHFKSRYVRTPEYEEEEAAGKMLYRHVFGTQPTDRSLFMDMKFKNPGNGNAVAWGGRVHAHFFGDVPYVLDPHTLETVGKETLGGNLRSSDFPGYTGDLFGPEVGEVVDRAMGHGRAFCTDPHFVAEDRASWPSRGDRQVCWSWAFHISPARFFRVYMQFMEFDREWELQSKISFTSDEGCYAPHDFGVTESYIVLPQSRTKMDMTPAFLGKSGAATCYKVAEGNTRVHLIDRRSGADQAFELEGEYLILHVGGACERGDGVVDMYCTGWKPELVTKVARGETSFGELGPWGAAMRGDFSQIVQTQLFHIRMDTRAGTATRRTLREEYSEFAQANTLWYSRPISTLWFVGGAGDAEVASPPQKVLSMNVLTGESREWYCGPECFANEALFVPREGSGERETCGYIAALCFDGARRRSFLAILDAEDVSQGPLCKLWLRHHVPFTVHGTWTTDYFGPRAA